MGKDDFVPCLKEHDIQDGQMKAIRVKGKAVLLIRKADVVYGLSNFCPHMGCSFERGILRDYQVMCPCHGWKFDIRTGKYTENDAIQLSSYPCKIERARIYINVNEKE